MAATCGAHAAHSHAPRRDTAQRALAAGRDHGEGRQEARRLAGDDVQETPVREHRVAAVIGGAEPVALHPPAVRRDAPLRVGRVEIVPLAVRAPMGVLLQLFDVGATG